MTARRAVIGIGALLFLAMLVLAWLMFVQTSSPPFWTGLFTGVALGGLNLLFESLSLSWAIRSKPSAMLMVSLGGFGLRLVLVSVLTIVFARVESVDAVSFALAYVASFLGFMGLQIWVASRIQPKAAPPDGGQDEGEQLK